MISIYSVTKPIGACQTGAFIVIKTNSCRNTQIYGYRVPNKESCRHFASEQLHSSEGCNRAVWDVRRSFKKASSCLQLREEGFCFTLCTLEHLIKVSCVCGVRGSGLTSSWCSCRYCLICFAVSLHGGVINLDFRNIMKDE